MILALIATALVALTIGFVLGATIVEARLTRRLDGPAVDLLERAIAAENAEQAAYLDRRP